MAFEFTQSAIFTAALICSNDLLWIREEFLHSQKNFGKYVVHGHTPVRSAEILANRANIDTGACATGNLTLLSIEGNRLLSI